MAGRGRGSGLLLKKLEEKAKQAEEAEKAKQVEEAKPEPEQQQSRVQVVQQNFQKLLIGGRGRGMIPKPPSSSSSGVDLDSLRGPGPRTYLPYEEAVKKFNSSDDQTGSSGNKIESGFFSRGRGRGILPSSSEGKQNQSSNASGGNLGESGEPCNGSAQTESTHTVSETPNLPEKKYGTAGVKYNAAINCMPIKCDPNRGIFEYFVTFNPPIDNVRIRRHCLKDIKSTIGNAYTFDGNVLQIPQRLDDDTCTFNTKAELCDGRNLEEKQIEITLKYQKQLRMGDCVKFYNLLFDRISKVLQYVRDGKKVFNPRNPPVVPAHKLEVWPGYVKSINEYEGGLMMNLDVSHRILHTSSVYEKFKELSRQRGSAEDGIRKQMIGRMVVTKYNNRSYRIDDLVFDKNCFMEFEIDDKKMTIFEYFKERHNYIIKDPKQFLIRSDLQVYVSGMQGKQKQEVFLVPECCYLTGLLDTQKNDFRVLKDLASFAKMTPQNRIAAYKKFIQNINETKEAKQILADWGLSVDNDSITAEARVLDHQKIIFGKNREISAGEKAEFSKGIMSNEVILAIDLNNWIIIAPKSETKTVTNFEEGMRSICKPTGIRVSNGRVILIENDRTETYCSAIRSALSTDDTVQIVVTIFPTPRDDRYAAVKKILCVERPVPSQCINSKTITDEKKFRSVILKIILQMNCKLGGALWGIKLPFKKTMFCGIDTYHGKNANVGGFCATMNDGITKYFARPALQNQKEELINGLMVCFEAALLCYYDENKCYPDSVVMYRDGVGQGQLAHVQKTEILLLKKAMAKISPDCKPKLTFVVVQKRVNEKFFKEVNNNKYDNASAGTIVDKFITHKSLYDFYIVSQFVNQGSATPSHYVVLEDENEYSADFLQRLTYKLCFMYWNWPGTVRVPAPCQYAHVSIKI